MKHIQICTQDKEKYISVYKEEDCVIRPNVGNHSFPDPDVGIVEGFAKYDIFYNGSRHWKN